MKVGIVTYQYAYNYGAVLQCIALQRTLCAMGVEAEVVNYLPPESKGAPFWRGWGLRDGRFFQHMAHRLIGIRHGKAMRRRFDEFRSKYMMLSTLCTTSAQLAVAARQYDAMVAGSDQIWHFSKPAGYFLEWGAPYAGKRISYAPCCGHTVQPQERAGQIKEWLSRFDHISVRNEFSKKIIEPLIGRPVPVVADPTLLTDLSDLQQKVELPCSNYILMYTLGKEIAGGHKKAIQAIREKVGNIPVVAVIPSAHLPHLAPWADVKIWEAGPAEWLYLIANAAFVYTDSFHGAIFALKHRRPFVVYYAEEARSPRMVDLALRYRLGGSVAQDVVSLAECLAGSAYVDYEESLRRMNVHAAASREYLHNSLIL